MPARPNPRKSSRARQESAHSAVDVDHLARDVLCSLTRQVTDQGGHLPRVGGPAVWNVSASRRLERIGGNRFIDTDSVWTFGGRLLNLAVCLSQKQTVRWTARCSAIRQKRTGG